MYLTTSLAVAVAAGFTTLGVAKVAKTPFMSTRASHVGLSPEAYQLIGLAEVAGALGVLGGLGFTPLGYISGSCILLLLAGAHIAHIRSGDKPGALVPAAVFTLATAGYLIALGGSR
jgi:hypothetical protein